MNYLSKSFITGTLALLITTAALASSMATSAESRGRVHFRHEFFHGHQCFDNRRRLVPCVVHFTGRHPGYVSGNSLVNDCGWRTVTFKKWNPSRTRLFTFTDKVWSCY